MPQNSRHIVSRLSWDTTLDHKTQAVALQEHLSNWSGFHLQQELNVGFDRFCPVAQTWKIESLELDLGTINFDTLEIELPIKLQQQLNEKLSALVLYPNQRNQQIEITDEKKTHLAFIRYFLIHGMLPWNYQIADGTINQMLAQQLQNNREELATMIKELGFGAAQARRRMAWQFNDHNMVKIIAALEPNVGGHIVMFSNELTAIQQKATVVQAISTTDFKKNVWFWVLNYLLTERGTVFNRVQFMKSSIQQMAAHYNMQYDALFEQIELALAKFNSNLNLQPDFILTLQLLSKENKARKKKKIKPVGKVDDYWVSLKTLLCDKNLRRVAGNELIFNDLVSSLAKQDPLRFKKLIRSFGQKPDFWLPIINELSDYSLKTIFISLTDNRITLLTESIFFLKQLMGRVMPQTQRNALWHSGLMFVLEYKSTSFKEVEFLEKLITVLAEKKQCNTLVLLDQLLIKEIPILLKTLHHTTFYRALVEVFRLEISRMSTQQFKKHLLQLMELFHLQVKGGIKDRKRFETLKNILENYNMFEPKKIKVALAVTPYLNSLALIFPLVTKANTTKVALKRQAAYTQSTTQQPLQTTQFNISKDKLTNLLDQPAQLLAYLQKEMISELQWNKLYRLLNFDQLLKTITSLQQSKQVLFDVLSQFYQFLGDISLNHIPTDEMQYILFKKVTKAWISGNWKLIATENIWNELVWEICGKRGVAKIEFLSIMDSKKIFLPAVLRLKLESLIVQDRSTDQTHKISTPKVKNQLSSISTAKIEEDVLKESINIKNAGLVLLSSYLTMLLSRLELVNGQSFNNSENQLAAVHYLQFVVTGLTHTEESFLPLNKLLCGVPLSQPVQDNIDISPAHQTLIEGLITAVIGHWPAIGTCSIDGFRGNWLVRDGLLSEKEDRWELTVDKRAYDLLIHKSPFSFSIIKYAWMNKPLHVNWPY